MAIIFEGMSTCPICDQLLDKGKPYMGFLPFTGNAKDRLFMFSDAGVHVDCLHNHPYGALALVHNNKCEEVVRPENRKCWVDGRIIDHMEHVIGFGMFTSDESEPLSKFNYMILNRLNLDRWPDRNAFISAAEEFLQAGKWGCLSEVNVLQIAINEVK
ncbi:hypothetical protein HGH93_30140 [Chitinophaga polysaccharea]|uniref:hypothetical protein n=1 Tax=Chitinophaga polysaccharea TaxID=1293035 RepID=UPI001455371F|nr:hypothetical protein [Chitinophaga polysaccharea]NLR62390.1 hypothetical protein [Chitinophaga polysaccharea]